MQNISIQLKNTFNQYWDETEVNRLADTTSYKRNERLC